jgi:antitoxin VapB
MQTARLFKNGRSQAVRLPKEYRLPGSQVLVKKVGRAVMLIPLDDPWGTLVDSLGMFSADFVEDRGQPAEQQSREDLFE